MNVEVVLRYVLPSALLWQTTGLDGTNVVRVTDDYSIHEGNIIVLSRRRRIEFWTLAGRRVQPEHSPVKKVDVLQKRRAMFFLTTPDRAILSFPSVLLC